MSDGWLAVAQPDPRTEDPPEGFGWYDLTHNLSVNGGAKVPIPIVFARCFVCAALIAPMDGPGHVAWHASIAGPAEGETP